MVKGSRLMSRYALGFFGGIQQTTADAGGSRYHIGVLLLLLLTFRVYTRLPSSSS